jgi:hypothetical protein
MILGLFPAEVMMEGAVMWRIIGKLLALLNADAKFGPEE